MAPDGLLHRNVVTIGVGSSNSFQTLPATGKSKPGEIEPLDKVSFQVIDQNNDGVITPSDFEFPVNPNLEGDAAANRIFSRLDDDSNGRLTIDELQQWFSKSAGESEFLSVNDLKKAVGLAKKTNRPKQKDAPNGPRVDPRWPMMKLLLSGELGSLTTGPEFDSEAPELDLPLVAHNKDGGLELSDRIIHLQDARGKKPVVLIFGSFT